MREPNDGRPFYCKTCGCGYAEFMACEQPDCELEDVDVALTRAYDTACAQEKP